MKKVFFLVFFLSNAFGKELVLSLYENNLFYITSDYIKEKTEKALFLKAESLFFTGNYNKAYQYYSLLKERSLDEIPEIYYKIGHCLWFLGRKKEAVSIYNDCLSRFFDTKEAPIVIFRIINYYIETKDYDKASSLFSNFLSLYPEIPWKDSIFYLLGTRFEDIKEYKKAIFYYKKALETQDIELRKKILLSLARVYYEIKDFENALLYAEKITKEFPGDEGYIIMFSSLFNMGRYEEAIFVFPKIKNPTRELYLIQGESLYALNKFEEAISYYIKGGGTLSVTYCYIKLSKLDIALKHINDDKTLYLIASLGKDNEKIIAYKRIIEEFPKSQFREEAFLNLSLLYLKMGSPTQACEICERMIKEYPKGNLSLIGLYNIGITLKDERYLLKLVELYPNFIKSPEILYKIGMDKIKKAKFNEAIEIFTSLREKYPKSHLFPYFLYNLAFCYNKIGNPHKARLIYRSIPSIEKDLKENGLFYAANISFNLKDYTLAIIDYKTLIDEYPKSRFFVPSLYQIGWCYYKKKKFKEAEKYFTKIISYYKESPYFPQALYWLGWCYFEQERYEAASIVYLRLQREFPDHALSNDALIRAGLCFYNQGKYKEAIEQYQMVLQKEKDRALLEEALYQIGEAFIKQDKIGSAINYYKNFLEKSRDTDLDKSIRKRLAWLYYLDGKKREARVEYERLLKEEVSEKDEVYYWIGRTFLPSSKKEAIYYFRRVCELYPQSKWAPDALFRIGVLFYSEKDYKNAASSFKTLIEKYKERKDLVKEAKEYLQKMK